MTRIHASSGSDLTGSSASVSFPGSISRHVRENMCTPARCWSIIVPPNEAPAGRMVSRAGCGAISNAGLAQDLNSALRTGYAWRKSEALDCAVGSRIGCRVDDTSSLVQCHLSRNVGKGSACRTDGACDAGVLSNRTIPPPRTLEPSVLTNKVKISIQNGTRATGWGQTATAPDTLPSRGRSGETTSPI